MIESAQNGVVLSDDEIKEQVDTIMFEVIIILLHQSNLTQKTQNGDNFFTTSFIWFLRRHRQKLLISLLCFGLH